MPRIFWWLLVTLLPAFPAATADVIAPGETIERDIVEGETHAYSFPLPLSGPVVVKVRQDSIDLVLELESPAGDRTLFDLPGDYVGREYLLIDLAEIPGARVSISPHRQRSRNGSYRLTLEEVSDPAKIDAFHALSRAASAFPGYTAEAQDAALKHLEVAYEALDSAGHADDAAFVLYYIAYIKSMQGEGEESAPAIRQAHAYWLALDDSEMTLASLILRLYVSVTRGETESVGELFESGAEIAAARPGEKKFRRLANEIEQINCLAMQYRRDLDRAARCYEPVLATARDLGDRSMEAVILNNRGGIEYMQSRPATALGYFEAARDIHLEAGNWLELVDAYNNLGITYRLGGDLRRALEVYREGEKILSRVADRSRHGSLFNNMGFAYALMGNARRAIEYYKLALTHEEQAGASRSMASTLTNLGNLERENGSIDEAIAFHQRALGLWQERDDKRGIANLLTALSRDWLADGNVNEARKYAQQAIALVPEANDRRKVAEAHEQLGAVELESGNLAAAIANLEKAGSIQNDIGNEAALLSIRKRTADVYAARGDFQLALKELESAVSLAEAMRSRVASVTLGPGFSQTRRAVDDARIAYLMALDARAPESQGRLRALEASEAARARTLIEVLQRASVDTSRRAPSELIARRDALLHEISALAQRRIRLLSRSSNAEAASEMAVRYFALVNDLDAVEAEVRALNPQAVTIQVATPRLAGIQALLDDDVTLIEYALGSDESYAWVVTNNDVNAIRLASRERIDAAARRAHRSLSEPPSERWLNDLSELYELRELVWAPLARHIGTDRIAVVPDGALHYVPFAALPETVDRDSYVPLIGTYEFVQLPSAYSLHTQRELLASRQPAEYAVAAIVDPIFAAEDARVIAGLSARNEQDGKRAAQSLESLRRLPWAAREGQAIAALIGEEDRLIADGSNATRKLFMSDELARYRIVHIATHGMLDEQAPELTGLVFSRVDADGNSIDGFVGLPDVYQLDWNADLVVLSGCDTALGERASGEGLVGLTRGFLYAGARAVISSLWQVSDRATAELMTNFYSTMFENDVPPLSALRQAQLSIAEQPEWKHPYFWSAFVYQGDWNFNGGQPASTPVAAIQ